VGIILTVQIAMGNVEVDRRNGTSHRRYHGYTTGAHNSEAAIGQANASEGRSGDLLLIQTAVTRPASTASAATTYGGIARPSAANMGSLKRKLST
jgi:hypothetical protein